MFIFNNKPRFENRACSFLVSFIQSVLKTKLLLLQHLEFLIVNWMFYISKAVSKMCLEAKKKRSNLKVVVPCLLQENGSTSSK